LSTKLTPPYGQLRRRPAESSLSPAKKELRHCRELDRLASRQSPACGMEVYATNARNPWQPMPCRGFGRVVSRSMAESKSLPEGSDLGPVATQIHAAPAPTVIFAGVAEKENAVGILALADSF
jgi:hypothetical protein